MATGASIMNFESRQLTNWKNWDCLIRKDHVHNHPSKAPWRRRQTIGYPVFIKPTSRSARGSELFNPRRNCAGGEKRMPLFCNRSTGSVQEASPARGRHHTGSKSWEESFCTPSRFQLPARATIVARGHLPEHARRRRLAAHACPVEEPKRE